MKVIFFLYAYVFACICHAAPLEELIDEDPELTPGYFEGDIILDDSNRNGLRNQSLIGRQAPLEELIDEDPELTPGYFEGDIILDDSNRNGLRNRARLWPKKTVFYHINNQFDKAHRNYILRAMRNIEAVSCIRFRSVKPSSKYYVRITGKSDGCYSQVGFLNKVQPLNLKIYPLDKGCFRIGSIMHELFHTLGFYHMQNTHNRDEYVRIVKQNIEKGKAQFFRRYPPNIVSNYGQGYDYGSITHYSDRAFSKNGKRTIIPLKQVAPGVMGQRSALSKKDINRLNRMYRCPKRA